jgi:pimeloyl-ACP methyl ester carboxylesterase
MKSQKIKFRDHHLMVYSNGNYAGTPILFLHGNSSSSNAWENQFNSHLSDKYHLIAYDFLGFGDSDHSGNPAEDYSINALTESLVTVINHYRLNDYFLVGHSVGGHVIAQTVDNLPGCRGIISIGAPPITKPPQIEKMYQPTAPVGIMFQKDYTEDDLDNVADNFFYSAPDAPGFFKSDFKRSDGHTRDAIGAILGSDYFKDEVRQLGSTQIPKVFISGEHEKSINNDYYHSLDFPGTWNQKLYVIPGTAHYPHWENALVVNDLIDRFVESSM